jgi:hypothetical protein
MKCLKNGVIGNFPTLGSRSGANLLKNGLFTRQQRTPKLAWVTGHLQDPDLNALPPRNGEVRARVRNRSRM